MGQTLRVEPIRRGGTDAPVRARASMCVALLAVLAGCDGRLEDPVAGPVDPDAPRPRPPAAIECDGTLDVDRAPLRRLSTAEYARTVRDLLGTDAATPSSTADASGGGFEVGAPVSPLDAEQLWSTAEDLAARADLARVVPCDAGAPGCAEALVRGFGRRAFRRPLAGDEVAALLAVHGAGDDFEDGARLVVHAVLVSPDFLYRVETGRDEDAGEVARLDGWEVASRLAYFFWGTMPDDALLDAAAEGDLSTPARIEAHARRLADDPRAATGRRDFARQWLGLERLRELTKDESVYPELDGATAASLHDSLEAFVVDSLEAGDVDRLLRSSELHVDRRLAELYGVDGSVGDALTRVSGDPIRHRGLLTHPGLLALLARDDQSDPIRRGLFVRRSLLCQQLPDPPNDVELTIEAPTIGLSTRERFAAHTADERCSGCHRLIDPIGFGLEAYDGIGRYREDDHGVPVDTTGEVIAGGDASGPFDGAAELAELLAGSDVARACVAEQITRYALRRSIGARDACARRAILDVGAATGWDLREIMIAVATSDAFVHLRREEAP